MGAIEGVAQSLEDFVDNLAGCLGKFLGDRLAVSRAGDFLRFICDRVVE